MGILLSDAGSSNQVLCDNLEGWGGVRGGRELQEIGEKVKALVAQLCPTLWDSRVVCQAPPSMELPRQGYWSG